jgi:osmoprotectant transport system permease protein
MNRNAVQLVLILGSVAAPSSAESVRVGSKAFTESVILAELATQLGREAGADVVHRRQLGGTRVLWEALLRGEIDAYPDYTGTIVQEILAGQDLKTEDDLRRSLAERGVGMTRSLGFNDTYALGMLEPVAQRLGVRSISDLRQHPELRFGFSNEFMDRKDGWPALRDRYRLPQANVNGLDHDLAYRALTAGSIDVTDLYSTDAEIQFYHLRVLEDDQHLFPEYKAVFMYRLDLQSRAPRVLDAIRRLEGVINEPRMIAMNAEAKLQRIPEERVASEFLAVEFGARTDSRPATLWMQLLRRTREHLVLVGISLAAAIACAVPLGIAAFRWPRVGQFILGAVAVIYTIPSLALLVFMIPLLGIGTWPAVVALFLYSLLPIVRNTHAGLAGIPLATRESAEVLGLPRLARLLHVELPMASPSILAGIKTSAVINVGTATLGALIGAGGYGQPILTGIRLADNRLILFGAVPAAVLAILVQFAFEGLERLVVPRGLRLRPAEHR